MNINRLNGISSFNQFTNKKANLNKDSYQAVSKSVRYDPKTYDMSEIMRIHKKGFHEIPTREESDYYWNVRKENPDLDQYLYDMDKAKVLKEIDEIQMLLIKASHGDKLTEKERIMLAKDPILAMEFKAQKKSNHYK